jgi:hypothetical protein
MDKKNKTEKRKKKKMWRRFNAENFLEQTELRLLKSSKFPAFMETENSIPKEAGQWTITGDILYPTSYLTIILLSSHRLLQNEWTEWVSGKENHEILNRSLSISPRTRHFASFVLRETSVNFIVCSRAQKSMAYWHAYWSTVMYIGSTLIQNSVVCGK